MRSFVLLQERNDNVQAGSTAAADFVCEPVATARACGDRELCRSIVGTSACAGRRGRRASAECHSIAAVGDGD